ncbi:MAG: diadenylate cyclase CdaA [Candidatus Omnitrophota bacterium]|nr:diadenylate cyclase CdaA [Candidatus Omnitrophota bacterium]
MEILQYWKLFLEIAILWYVIYMTLLFVKGTRSEQLLKGLVIISLIFIITQQLGLNAISWALTRLFPISVIALVVIFQPELRRGLAQLGQFGIHQENIEVIEELSRAALELSRKRVGALIAIEREAGLKNYIETGTLLDAKITTDLLISIFIPQSPLHDGAVIVRHGRLVAAGCVFPLTQEERGIPKNMGMRHRAAIGVTEETDAICVVVSEETGIISVTSGGKLTRDIDEENLVKILKNVFYHSSKKKIPFYLIKSKHA